MLDVADIAGERVAQEVLGEGWGWVSEVAIDNFGRQAMDLWLFLPLLEFPTSLSMILTPFA